MKNTAQVIGSDSSVIGNELSMLLHKGIWRENRQDMFPEYFKAQQQDAQLFYEFFSTGGYFPINSDVIALLLQGKIDFKTFEKETTKYLQEQDKTSYKKMQEHIKNKPFKQQAKKTNNSRYMRIPGYIYVIRQDDFFKIGKALDMQNRMKMYITENPNELEVIIEHKVNNYGYVEKHLHNMFKSKRIRGEWFKLTNTDIVTIKAYLKTR